MRENTRIPTAVETNVFCNGETEKSSFYANKFSFVLQKFSQIFTLGSEQCSHLDKNIVVLDAVYDFVNFCVACFEPCAVNMLLKKSLHTIRKTRMKEVNSVPSLKKNLLLGGIMVVHMLDVSKTLLEKCRSFSSDC